MAVTIISESYGPRKPFVTCTAASTDELAEYAGLWAEGSEATISDTKYILDRTKGWVDENGGGGGGGGGVLIVNAVVDDTDPQSITVVSVDKTTEEVYTAAQSVHVEAHVVGFGALDVLALPLLYTSITDDTYDVVFAFVDVDGKVYQLDMFGDEYFFDVFPLNLSSSPYIHE